MPGGLSQTPDMTVSKENLGKDDMHKYNHTHSPVPYDLVNTVWKLIVFSCTSNFLEFLLNRSS